MKTTLKLIYKDNTAIPTLKCPHTNNTTLTTQQCHHITHPPPTETTWHLCYTRTHTTTAKTRGHKSVMTVLCRRWQESTHKNTTQTSTSYQSQYPISHLSAQMTWSEANVPNSNSQHYYLNICKDLKINSNSIWCRVTLAQDDYTNQETTKFLISYHQKINP